MSSAIFFSALIREGRVALSVGHPRETHSRCVIGRCLIPLGIYGLKNNSRRISYGIGCVWGCLLCPLYPLLVYAHFPVGYHVDEKLENLLRDKQQTILLPTNISV